MPGSTLEVPSVTSKIDENSRNEQTRHSLQPTSRTIPENSQVKRHSSMVHPVRKPSLISQIKKPSVPDIPEADVSEAELGTAGITRGWSTVSTGTVRKSFLKSAQVRKVSSVSRSNSRTEKGNLNGGFDQSAKSSMHGSVTSLPVIREQYCCCQRWTRLERILALIVAVFAIIIVGLIIAVGCLAGKNTDSLSSTFLFKL